MAISDKLKNMVSNWNQSEVPSEFGDISYYGLLRNTLKIVQQLILDWESASGEFDSQIAEATKLVEQLKGDYTQFVNDVNNTVTQYMTEVNNTVDTYKRDTDSKINANNQLVNQLQENVNTFYANVTASVNGLSNEFNDLKTYVENYLGSDDFLQAMADEIGRQINDNPDFAELVRQAVESLKPIHFADVGVTEANDKTAFENAVKTVALLLTGGTMSGTLLLKNNISISGLDTTGKTVQIARLNDINNIYLGSTLTPIQLNSSTKPKWGDGSTIKFLALEEDVVSKLPLSGGTMTGNINLNNTVSIMGKSTDTKLYNLLSLINTDEILIGSSGKNVRISSYTKPVWYNGVNSKAIALEEEVTNKMPVSGGTFTGAVALSNNIALYGKDSTGANTPIGIINNSNQVLIGSSSNPLYLRSSTRPKVVVNSVEQQLAYLSDVTGGGGGDYLPLTGGTLTGSLVLNNNIPLFQKNSGGTNVNLLNLDTTNTLNIGDSSIAFNFNSASRPVINVGQSQHQLAYLDDISGGGSGDYLPLSGGTMSNNSRIKFPDSNNNSNFYVGYDGISMECNNNAPDFYIKNMGNGQVRNMVRSIRNTTSDYEVTNIYGDSNAPTQIESYSRPVVIEYGSSTQNQIAYLSDISGGGGGVQQQIINKVFTIQASGQTSQVVSFTADEFTTFGITDYDLSKYQIDLYATYTVDSSATNEKIDFKYSSASNTSNNVKLYGTGYFRTSLGKNIFSFEIFKNENFTSNEFNGILYMRLLKVG